MEGQTFQNAYGEIASVIKGPMKLKCTYHIYYGRYGDETCGKPTDLIFVEQARQYILCKDCINKTLSYRFGTKL